MDLTVFHQNLPVKFKELSKIIAKNGFKTGVIGGVPRDYLLYQKIGDDFDCELRPMPGKSLKDWDSLILNLEKTYDLEKLGFNVVRIKLGLITAELTLPRIEHFDGSKGHSNFKAEHIEDLDYTQGFSRRDFTINAIMFEFNGQQWQFIDPLNGYDDLQNKLLRSCASAFAMDPVRFLRAFRFRVNLVFSFSEQLEEALEGMELDGLSKHYIKIELSKAKRPVIMLKRILDFRPGFIDELVIHSDNKTIIEYDNLYQGDLEKHLKQAVVLSVQSREFILNFLGMSIKHILPNIKFDISWKSLIEMSFEKEEFKQFYETLSKLEVTELSVERFEYLMNYLGLELSQEDFNKFKETKYELSTNDKEQPKEYYKYIVFQKRLKELL